MEVTSEDLVNLGNVLKQTVDNQEAYRKAAKPDDGADYTLYVKGALQQCFLALFSAAGKYNDQLPDDQPTVGT